MYIHLKKTYKLIKWNTEMMQYNISISDYVIIIRFLGYLTSRICITYKYLQGVITIVIVPLVLCPTNLSVREGETGYREETFPSCYDDVLRDLPHHTHRVF